MNLLDLNKSVLLLHWQFSMITNVNHKNSKRKRKLYTTDLLVIFLQSFKNAVSTKKSSTYMTPVKPHILDKAIEKESH